MEDLSYKNQSSFANENLGEPNDLEQLDQILE